MKLSNQAQWYLRGNFPVYKRSTFGHAEVEPQAMQELVDKGLAFLMTHPLLGECWLLTKEGNMEKCYLEYPQFRPEPLTVDTSV
jgi:hypothetical protein